MGLLEISRRQLLVAHVSAIPVRIDYRWFAVWALMSLLTAVNIPDSLVGDDLLKFAVGALTILAFFFTVFLHEYAHAFVARAEGIDVVEIVLHPFGGVARMRHEPKTPGAEFRIAIAGPAASFLIAGAFLGLWIFSSSLETSVLSPIFFFLFLLNLLLAVFNLFPGYPLDGGRVLRAVLWKRGADLNSATITTGKFGQIIGAALIFFGIAIAFINADLLTSLWTVVVGLFLLDAATSIIRRIRNFETVIAGDLMELAVIADPDSTVMEFIDTTLAMYGKAIFPVARDRQLHGFLLLADLKRDLPRDKWRTTKVCDAMRPVERDHFVDASDPVSEAKEMMEGNGIGAVGVLDGDGKLIGVLELNRLLKPK